MLFYKKNIYNRLSLLLSSFFVMKLKNKKIFINSFIIAFFVSFITIYILFPGLEKILYTDINSWVNISLWFLIKILAVLWWQTSLLWSIFYAIAKKIFLK